MWYQKKTIDDSNKSLTEDVLEEGPIKNLVKAGANAAGREMLKQSIINNWDKYKDVYKHSTLELSIIAGGASEKKTLKNPTSLNQVLEFYKEFVRLGKTKGVTTAVIRLNFEYKNKNVDQLLLKINDGKVVSNFYKEVLNRCNISMEDAKDVATTEDQKTTELVDKPDDTKESTENNDSSATKVTDQKPESKEKTSAVTKEEVKATTDLVRDALNNYTEYMKERNIIAPLAKQKKDAEKGKADKLSQEQDAELKRHIILRNRFLATYKSKITEIKHTTNKDMEQIKTILKDFYKLIQSVNSSVKTNESIDNSNKEYELIEKFLSE